MRKQIVILWNKHATAKYLHDNTILYYNLLDLGA